MASSSIREAIEAESTPICFIMAADLEVSKTNTVVPVILNVLIGKLVNFIQVGKKMNEEDIKETVSLICQNPLCKNLKPEDFVVCFNLVKQGYYGEFYDRLDGHFIFSCLNKYCNERMDTYERMKIAESNEAKRLAKETQMHPKIVEVLKTAIKEVGASEKKVVTEKEVKEMDVRIKLFLDSFFEQWKANPYDKGTVGKFIEYKGKVVNEMQYVEIRIAEHNENLKNDSHE